MKEKIIISVALCTYNGENFLTQQLNSIINQTCPVDEIIICDDGSMDKTIEIINDFKKKYPNLIHLYRNELNLKSVKNFEKCIKLCNGKYVFLSDQDDVWLENKVEFILNYFNNNTFIDCVATNGYLINENNEVLDLFPIWDIFNIINLYSNKDYLSLITICGNFSTGATMAFKKDKILTFNNFQEIENYHHDEWIAFNFMLNNTFAFIKDKLIKYRLHSNQQVGSVAIKPKNKNTIIEYFNINNENISFNNLKKRLKNIAKSINKKPKKYNQIQHSFLNCNFNNLNEVYIFHTNLINKKYPLRSFILNIIDKITKKRQL